ncbi:unnamed protein product [Toxocara canis]|uniref:3-demethylubiquinol 3-O-methyltransferase n=1 Tax=Toxocara canis TaxID=6265 RepID=A0A183URT5_TOXCA|nr:unnamed protein product [Toxocara canis]
MLRCLRGSRGAVLCPKVVSCSSTISTSFGIRVFGDAPSLSTSVDPDEVQRFGQLSTQWACESGSFKALHSLNQLRVPWIVDTVAKLESEPDAIRAARIALSSAFYGSQPQPSGDVHLECTTVEHFSKNNAAAFDAVIASEIVEHVANIDTFVEACVHLARPGAPLFFTTINRTIASRVFAIFLAEEVFGIVPRGVHEWSKFVVRDVLRNKLEINGCDVRLVHGITYNPLTNKWSWSNCTAVNYAMMAVKRRSS